MFSSGPSPRRRRARRACHDPAYDDNRLALRLPWDRIYIGCNPNVKRELTAPRYTAV
ncbi:hypothetical protein SPHINGOT1_470002 [Sphingomonas sp. T1]|nr:hypothetical protein SPHINGOT1_470002 [Sphingomonas sp. T1]